MYNFYNHVLGELTMISENLYHVIQYPIINWCKDIKSRMNTPERSSWRATSAWGSWWRVMSRRGTRAQMRRKISRRTSTWCLMRRKRRVSKSRPRIGRRSYRSTGRISWRGIRGSSFNSSLLLYWHSSLPSLTSYPRLQQEVRSISYYPNTTKIVS